MKTTNIRFCFYFYCIGETTFRHFVTPPENWCIFWSSKIRRLDFDATVVTTINKVTPDSLITGCNFRFNQCLWGQIQNTGLNRENEQVLLLSRMCAALANITFSKVEKVRLVIYAQ